MSQVTSQLTFDEANDLAQQLIKANYIVELKQDDNKWIVIVSAIRSPVPKNPKVFT